MANKRFYQKCMHQSRSGNVIFAVCNFVYYGLLIHFCGQNSFEPQLNVFLFWKNRMFFFKNCKKLYFFSKNNTVCATFNCLRCIIFVNKYTMFVELLKIAFVQYFSQKLFIYLFIHDGLHAIHVALNEKKCNFCF